MLSSAELERYQKQILLSEIGEHGQELLKRASVLIIGAGGVGSPAALYLAGAGIGRIGLADGDTVALSNLHRQLLYRSKDIGRLKVDAAKEDLNALNPEIQIRIYSNYLDYNQVKQIAEGYDFIVDAADGMETKLMIADACAAARKPHCHAMIGQFRAQVMTCMPDRGNCFRCLFANGAHYRPVRTGTLNAICGIAGCVQASEAMKYILGIEMLLTTHVLFVDLLENQFHKISFCRKSFCNRVR